MPRFLGLATLPLVLLLAAEATPQSSTYGNLEGVVRDAQGFALPGVSVTLYGAASLGAPNIATEVNGRYLFRALTPGTYNLRFEIPGFQTLVREGIIISIGTTITINATLQLAGVEESVTVTGASPTVDVKTTRVGGTFNETALQDIPSATDIWAVLAQSPGIRMRGYDVGGSHKAQQTGYETFGIRRQNRIDSDGVDTTEGRGGTGFYADYYSIEEFQVSASGADVEMTGPGASVVMTIKSGGNEFSGLFHVDYEGESMVSDNVDDELAERGFTGNPTLLLWETHADVGGPIVKDKAWFYGSYNHFKNDKVRSGIDPELATSQGIFDNYIAKLTFQAGERDKIIGYSQWARKQAPNRSLSVQRPEETVWDQDGWSWLHKAEWQRIWSGRLFSNVQVKHFGLGVDFIPNSDPATHPTRVDTATGRFSGSGGSSMPERWKPHVSAQVNYYLPSRAGSHDFKFGFEWLLDSRRRNAQTPAIEYRDNSNLGRPMNVDEIQLRNRPTLADNRDTHLDFYAQDIWTLSDRLTLSLGVRLSRQSAHYQESVLNPTLPNFFQTGSRPGRSLVTWLNAAPRLGVTYDVTGQGKTAVKAHFGRYYINLAQSLGGANPNGESFERYKFADPNENGLYDGAHELGPLVFQTSEGEGTPVNPDLTPSYADELSFSLEHEVADDTSVRLSYVYKRLANDYGVWNRAQELPLRSAGIPCGGDAFPCPLDPFTGAPLNIARVPDEAAGQQDVLYDTFPDSDMNWDTLQVAASKRFRGNFFVQGSFDYQWRDELRGASRESRSVFSADPSTTLSSGNFFWQNHSLDVPYRQDNTNWQGKLLARYVFPQGMAVSTNIRHQSGWPWAPIHRVRIPGSGTQPIFLEDIENNRSENVTVVDFRLEKVFAFAGGRRLTGMVDFYNLFNGNPEVNFILRTGRSFRNIIAALDPRAIKVGVRFQF